MTITVLHQRTKAVKADTLRGTITAQLHHIEGNSSPHFSVTAVFDEKFDGRWQKEALGGCCHEEIMALAPEFEPVIRVHLSDDRGWPMHAVANGLYWMGLTDYPEARDLTVLARHLRCSEGAGRDLTAKVEAVQAGPSGLLREARHAALRRLIEESLAHQWADEAAAAVAFLQEG